ncbi:MAG: hypothetical protein K0U41_05335 [Gammaproteobacteria bacterium]|nr:hypothetical protein [Gammaproteobacteria bacterium]
MPQPVCANGGNRTSNEVGLAGNNGRNHGRSAEHAVHASCRRARLDEWHGQHYCCIGEMRLIAMAEAGPSIKLVATDTTSHKDSRTSSPTTGRCLSRAKSRV